MADERPTQQIREGAGLEESRLSQDTIDLLTKWGWPLLMVLALVGAGYAGLNYLRQQRANRLDNAFAQLSSAEQSRSPDALLGVAQDFSSVGSVPVIARLSAADIHLHSARARVAPGADLNPDGTPKDGAVLTDDQRKQQLDSAQKLYQQVADETAGKPALAMHHIGATFGLAAVAECREDWEAARGFYTRAAESAKAASLPDLATAAQQRIASIDSIKAVPKVFAAADLYGAPKPVPPAPAPEPVKLDPAPNQPSLPPPPLPGATAPAPSPTPATAPGTEPAKPVEPAPATPPAPGR